MSRYRAVEEVLLVRLRCPDCGVEWLVNHPALKSCRTSFGPLSLLGLKAGVSRGDSDESFQSSGF